MSKHHSLGHGHHHHSHRGDGGGHIANAGGGKGDGGRNHGDGGHEGGDGHTLNGQVADLLTRRSGSAKIGKHLHNAEGKSGGNGDPQSLEFTAEKIFPKETGRVVHISDLPTGTAERKVSKVTKDSSGNDTSIEVTHLPTAQLASAEMLAGGGGGKTFERTAATQRVAADGTTTGDGRTDAPGNPTDGRAEAPTAQRAANPLDGKVSVADMILQGKFTDKQSDAGDQSQKDNVLKPGEIPRIKVQYEDQTKDPANPQAKPNFIVNKDGSIEVVHNPEKNPSKEIIVQVQRDAGQTGPATQQQQESLEKLVPYLAQRVEESPEYKKVSQGKVAVEDPQNLVKDEVEASIKNNLNKAPTPDVSKPPVPEVPQDTGDVSGRMNRVQGSGGGRESFGSGADGTVPQRDVAPARDNTPPVQAVEDTVAALAGVDKQRPYESIKQRSDGSYGVGRYAMSYGNMMGFLADMLGIDLGDPPDYSKLQEYLKKHPEAMKALQQKMQAMAKDDKVPKEFADKFNDPKFGEQFVNFIDKLQGKGGAITPEELKTFMPKELQETVAQNRIETMGRQMGIDTNKDLADGDAGKLALGMFLGRKPNEADFANPMNQKYMQTAENVYKLALAGQFGSDRIDVSEVGGKLVASAAGNVNERLWAQTQWARYCENGNLGCAASVSKILQETGVLRQGEGSAGVSGLAGILRKKGFEEIQVRDKSQFKPGDVVYGLNGSKGHIGIIGEVKNGQVWVYDNSSASGQWSHRTIERGGSFVPGGRFGSNLYVLRPKAA